MAEMQGQELVEVAPGVYRLPGQPAVLPVSPQFIAQAAAASGSGRPPPGISIADWEKARKENADKWIQNEFLAKKGKVSRIPPLGSNLTQVEWDKAIEDWNKGVSSVFITSYETPSQAREFYLRRQWEAGQITDRELTELNTLYAQSGIAKGESRLKLGSPDIKSQEYLKYGKDNPYVAEYTSTQFPIKRYEQMGIKSQERIDEANKILAPYKVPDKEDTYLIGKAIAEGVGKKDIIDAGFSEEQYQTVQKQVQAANPKITSMPTAPAAAATAAITPVAAPGKIASDYESGKSFVLEDELLKGADPDVLVEAGFNRVDVQTAVANVARNIKLPDGQWISRDDYALFTTDDSKAKEALDEGGLKAYNAYVAETGRVNAVKQQPTITLDNGDIISKESYNLLISSPGVSDDAVEILNTQGIEAFKTFIQGLQDVSEIQRLQFIADNVQIGDLFYKRSDVAKLTPAEKTLLEVQSTKGFVGDVGSLGITPIPVQQVPQPGIQMPQQMTAEQKRLNLSILGKIASGQPFFNRKELAYLESETGKAAYPWNQPKLYPIMGKVALVETPFVGSGYLYAIGEPGIATVSLAGDVLFFTPWGLIAKPMGRAAKTTAKFFNEAIPDLPTLQKLAKDEDGLILLDRTGGKAALSEQTLSDIEKAFIRGELRGVKLQEPETPIEPFKIVKYPKQPEPETPYELGAKEQAAKIAEIKRSASMRQEEIAAYQQYLEKIGSKPLGHVQPPAVSKFDIATYNPDIPLPSNYYGTRLYARTSPASVIARTIPEIVPLVTTAAPISPASISSAKPAGFTPVLTPSASPLTPEVTPFTSLPPGRLPEVVPPATVTELTPTETETVAPFVPTETKPAITTLGVSPDTSTKVPERTFAPITMEKVSGTGISVTGAEKVRQEEAQTKEAARIKEEAKQEVSKLLSEPVKEASRISQEIKAKEKLGLPITTEERQSLANAKDKANKALQRFALTHPAPTITAPEPPKALSRASQRHEALQYARELTSARHMPGTAPGEQQYIIEDAIAKVISIVGVENVTIVDKQGTFYPLEAIGYSGAQTIDPEYVILNSSVTMPLVKFPGFKVLVANPETQEGQTGLDDLFKELSDFLKKQRGRQVGEPLGIPADISEALKEAWKSLERDRQEALKEQPAPEPEIVPQIAAMPSEVPEPYRQVNPVSSGAGATPSTMPRQGLQPMATQSAIQEQTALQSGLQVAPSTISGTRTGTQPSTGTQTGSKTDTRTDTKTRPREATRTGQDIQPSLQQAIKIETRPDIKLDIFTPTRPDIYVAPGTIPKPEIKVPTLTKIVPGTPEIKEPPPPPPGKGKPGKPFRPFIPFRGKPKKIPKELAGKDLEGAYTFRSGLVNITIIKPYREEDVYYHDEPLVEAGYPDRGTPQETLTVIGTPPKRPVNVDIGAYNVNIANKSIRFTRRKGTRRLPRTGRSRRYRTNPSIGSLR